LDITIQMCMIGNEELGACALIKPISDGNLYMQTSSIEDGLRVYLFDQVTYEILFSEIK